MEQMEKIYNSVKSFITRQFGIQDYNDINVTFERLNGLSNAIFLVKIINKTTGSLIHQIIYRSFGEISDLVDRDLETKIIHNLSKKGITPKIYETDNQTYRIEEFV